MGARRFEDGWKQRDKTELDSPSGSKGNGRSKVVERAEVSRMTCHNATTDFVQGTKL